jgi:[ribosomal protein S5]-alanine N-acetyltransferase
VTASIVADRISMIAMTPGFLRASIEGDLREAEMQIKLSLPQGWPDIADVLALRLRQLEADPTLQPWLLRAIALRATGEMIGHIGFHTAPGARYLNAWSPGGVEYGFTIFPPYRRRGYAREASVVLMRWASEVHGVRSFVATVSPGNTASQDEVDVIEIVFVLDRDAHAENLQG